MADHPDAAFSAIEATVVTALHTHAAALTAGVLQASQRGLRPGRHRRRPRCPACGHRMRWHRWRRRMLLSRSGPVRWERPLARCHPCGHELAPTDASLGLAAGQRVSAGLTAGLTALGEAASFAEGAALLAQLTGVALATEAVRSHTETTGAALVAAADAAAAALAAADDPPGPAAVPPGQLVVEAACPAAGVMVRYQDGWHEAKVGLVGGWVVPAAAAAPALAAAPAGRGRTGRLVAASSGARRAAPPFFGALWGTDPARRGARVSGPDSCRGEARGVVGWTGRGNGPAVLPKARVRPRLPSRLRSPLERTPRRSRDGGRGPDSGLPSTAVGVPTPVSPRRRSGSRSALEECARGEARRCWATERTGSGRRRPSGSASGWR